MKASDETRVPTLSKKARKRLKEPHDPNTPRDLKQLRRRRRKLARKEKVTSYDNAQINNDRHCLAWVGHGSQVGLTAEMKQSLAFLLDEKQGELMRRLRRPQFPTAEDVNRPL